MDLEFITKTDTWIHTHISELYNPILNKTVIFITTLGNMSSAVAISVILVSYLVYKKYFKDALFYTLAIVGSAALMFTIKNIVSRPRPVHHLIEASGYSFPSGHATISATIAFSVYHIFKYRTKYTNLLLVSCIMWAVAISFSRVYLNVHYLSDVVGGIGLGLFWSSLVTLIFRKSLDR